MNYLKKYKKFLEDADFVINATDSPDLQISKENFEVIKTQLTEYKTKKILIDNAYKTITDNINLQKKLEELVGKDNKNPFLVEYLHVSSLKNNIDKLQKELVNDKISKDDFTEQLRLSSEKVTKDAINIKLIDINKRISDKNTNILKLQNDVKNSETQLQTNMNNIEKEMKDYIKKISEEDINLK